VSILKFLGLEDPNQPQPSASETEEQISWALSQLTPERARYVAAFAFMLARVANADNHISETELKTMRQIVQREGDLPEAQADIVVRIAKDRGHCAPIDDYLVSTNFGRYTSRPEKISLLQCIFALASSDHMVSIAEEEEIRKIAIDIGLTMKDFVAVRYNFLKYLERFKKMAGI
jgi:uncharacterized tellurite resistance protein B-like protein